MRKYVVNYARKFPEHRVFDTYTTESLVNESPLIRYKVTYHP